MVHILSRFLVYFSLIVYRHFRWKLIARVTGLHRQFKLGYHVRNKIKHFWVEFFIGLSDTVYRARMGNLILLNSMFFRLENCGCCDSVTVYDGASTSSTLLQSFCHDNGRGRPVYSSSNYLTVVFKTDFSITNIGFKAIYNTGQDSCRYNCGYNLRTCSCSSSCKFTGNCCPDFCDHCGYTDFGKIWIVMIISYVFCILHTLYNTLFFFLSLLQNIVLAQWEREFLGQQN